MLVGKAKGGPLDGVKLSAQYTWNGEVAHPAGKTRFGQTIPAHPGNYLWDRKAQTWVWRPKCRAPMAS